MNSVILIEDLLMISEMNSGKNIKEELLSIISQIKENDKEAKMIKINELLQCRVKEEVQTAKLKENKNEYNKIVQSWEEYNDIQIGIVSYVNNDKSKTNSNENINQVQSVSQKDQSISISSANIQIQIPFISEGFSRVFRINSEFLMTNPIIILDQYKDRILKDENEICLQLDEVVQAIGDILMKEKERNVGEVEQYNLACENAIPYLGQFVKNWKQRYERTKQIQIRKYEKQALIILSHIVTQGIYYQNQQQKFLFQAQFELTGLRELFEKIIVKFENESNNNQRNEELKNEIQKKNGNDIYQLELFLNIINLILQKNNENHKQGLIKIIQYIKDFIDIYSKRQIEQNLGNSIITDNKCEVDNNVRLVSYCVQSLVSYAYDETKYNKILSPEYAEIIHILVQLSLLKLSNTNQFYLLQASTLRGISQLIPDQLHLITFTQEYNLIQRINYNLKDTLTSPYNFTLVLRAKNSLFLLTAIINEQQIQFKPEIIEVDLVVFFKSLVSKSRVYSQSSTTSELIWRFCIDSFCKAMHNPGGNASSFVHNSKLMQVLSLWMCNAGGEEQNDAKIIETMEKLIWFNFNYPQHKKYGKNDLDGLFEQKERDLLVTENFEEQMIEEGAKEDCEANIFSQKSNIKQKSIQLKTELMGLNWH